MKQEQGFFFLLKKIFHWLDIIFWMGFWNVLIRCLIWLNWQYSFTRYSIYLKLMLRFNSIWNINVIELKVHDVANTIENFPRQFPVCGLWHSGLSSVSGGNTLTMSELMCVAMKCCFIVDGVNIVSYIGACFNAKSYIAIRLKLAQIVLPRGRRRGGWIEALLAKMWRARVYK